MLAFLNVETSLLCAHKVAQRWDLSYNYRILMTKKEKVQRPPI